MNGNTCFSCRSANTVNLISSATDDSAAGLNGLDTVPLFWYALLQLKALLK